MGFYNKHNNADGKYPDYGAIFMSNSGTKKECFKRGLFGLPSSAIQFVEQVKAGMILFLFENEKRHLHGVFQAADDGALNVVPNAFNQQFPAQVKFVQIWNCKPLSESLFRDVIRENYFTANKFNFGLSEKQVVKLLKLFNKRMLDLESESYTTGKSGRFVDHGMHVRSVKDEQGVGAKISPIRRHKRQGDSLQFYGEVENSGFNASGVVANKQGRASEFAPTSGYAGDYFSFQDEFGYATRDKEQYLDLHLKPTISGGGYPRTPTDIIRVHDDDIFSRSHRLMSEDLRPTGQRMFFSDDNPDLRHSNVNPSEFHGKPILEQNSLVQDLLRPTSAMTPIQEQILNNSSTTHGNAGTKCTLLYNPDYPGLDFSQSSPVRTNYGYNSMLESASLPNNCRRNYSLSNPTSLMPMEVNDMNRCYDAGYEFLNHALYNSHRDSMPSNVAQNADQTKSVAYEAPNGISSFNYSSALGLPSDIGNSGRVHDPFSYLFPNCKSYVGNDVHPMAMKANLGHELTLEKSHVSFTHDIPWRNEGHSQVQYGDLLVHEYDTECHGKSKNDCFGYPKKKSSVFSRLSCMQDNNKQRNGNNALNEISHFNTSVEEVMEMVRQNHNQWMQKRKPRPLIKRLKTEILRDKIQFTSSRVQSDSAGGTLNDARHSKAESLRDKTQTISSRIKSDSAENTLSDVRRNKIESSRDKSQTISSRIKTHCFGDTLNDVSTELNATSYDNTSKTPDVFVDFKRRSKVRKLDDEGKTVSAASDNTSKTHEEKCFVNFKHHSKVRKLDDESKKGSSNEREKMENVVLVQQKRSKVGSSNECEKSENVVRVQQKRRKLIRPNFTKSPTSDDKGIDLGMPQNLQLPSLHESYDLSYVSESDRALVLTDTNLTTDAEMENLIDQTHSGDKRSSHFRGFVSNEGVKASNGTLPAFNDGSECLHNINTPNASSACCTDKSCHIQKGLHVIDGMESLRLISQEHQADMVIRADRGADTEGVSKDGNSSFTNEVKVRASCLEKFGNENAPNGTSRISEGSPVVDSIKSASQDTESLQSICQEHHVDKVTCAGRGIVTEEDLSKDGGSSFNIEVENGFECMQSSGNEKAAMKTSSHVKEASHVMDSTKSTSCDTKALHSLCQELHLDTIICAGRGIDTGNEVSKDGGSSFTVVEVKNRSEASSHVKKASHVMDSTISVSPDTEALHLICQEHHAGKIICAGSGRGIEDEVSKDGGSSFTIVEVKDRSECMWNVGTEKASMKSSSHVKEALHVMDSTKSASPDTEALQLICKEHHADKIMCAGSGRSIDAEREESKDGGSSFAVVEVKDRFECTQNFGKEKAAMETSSHVKEASHVMDCTKLASLDTEALHSICQDHQVDKIKCAGSGRGVDEVSKDSGSSFTIEAKDGSI